MPTPSGSSWSEAGRISLLSLLLALTYNFFSPHRVPLIYEPHQVIQAQDSATAGDTAAVEPLAVDLPQAEQLFHGGKALFIDARHEDEFLLGHIKGAISLPLDTLDKNPARLRAIPKDALIVTYCSGEECALSTDLGFKLAALGYRNVRIFFSGWLEWQRVKLPVETGLPDGHR